MKRKRVISRWLLSAILSILCWLPASSQEIDSKSLRQWVEPYIIKFRVSGESEKQEARILSGIGIILNNSGDMLTAKHVVGADFAWSINEDGIVNGRKTIEIFRVRRSGKVIGPTSSTSSGSAVVTSTSGIDLARVRNLGVAIKEGVRPLKFGCATDDDFEENHVVFIVTWRTKDGKTGQPGTQISMRPRLKIIEAKVADGSQRVGLVELNGATEFIGGDSGAPVFNEKGELVGVFTERGEGDSSKLGFFEPIANAQNLLTGVMKLPCGGGDQSSYLSTVRAFRGNSDSAETKRALADLIKLDTSLARVAFYRNARDLKGVETDLNHLNYRKQLLAQSICVSSNYSRTSAKRFRRVTYALNTRTSKRSCEQICSDQSIGATCYDAMFIHGKLATEAFSAGAMTKREKCNSVNNGKHNANYCCCGLSK